MKYSIYQIKREKTRELGYLGLATFREWSKQPGTIIMGGVYNLVYEGEVQTEVKDSTSKTLEALFYKFNMEHPKDFRGRSVSVGDIVKLGSVFYYCDSCGFERIKVRAVPTVIPAES